MKSHLATLIIAISLSISLSQAQTVGVVMNGGGAKGLYHIGVLEALEESGVPIDYVAGTSMGAIVAGLYAAGYSPAEIHELATSDEINNWVTGYIDPNYGYYFRNNSHTLRQGNSILSLRLDPSKKDNSPKLGVPQSVISTTPIDMALNRLFSPATIASKGDFSQLMIPFLCVASNITSGRDTIYMHGDLGLAIRASMAIPLAYKPIADKHGNIMFDGGIYNNFPVEDMQREYDPDLIIGVVCTNEEIESSNSLSLFDQAIMLIMNRRIATMPENSVLIDRDVDVGMLDFNSAKEVIQMGYDDTMLKLDSIMLHLDGSTLLDESYYADRREAFNRQKPEIEYESYDIEGLTLQQRFYVDRSITPSRKSRKDANEELMTLSFEQLQKNLYKVLTTGDFTTEYPQTIYNDSTALSTFKIKMDNKPSMKLTFGGNLSSTPFTQIYLGWNYTSIKHVKQSYNAEAYLGPIYMTGRVGYRAEFYSYMPLFIDAYFHYTNKNLQHGSFGNLTSVTNTPAIKYTDQFLSVGVGTPLLRRSYLQIRSNLGVEVFDHDAELAESMGQNIFSRTRFRYNATKIDIEKSTLDDIYYPSKGQSLSFSLINIIGNESSYATAESNSSITSKFSNRRSWVGAKASYRVFFNANPSSLLSMGLSFDGIYTTVPNMYSQTTRQFLMPAFQPTTHSKMIYMPEYSATQYIAAGIMPTVRIVDRLRVRAEAYGMLRERYVDPLSTASTSANEDQLQMKYISQISLIYDSAIGTMSIAASKYGITNWNNTYLTFNFGHTIFSPRGTFD